MEYDEVSLKMKLQRAYYGRMGEKDLGIFLLSYNFKFQGKI